MRSQTLLTFNSPKKILNHKGFPMRSTLLKSCLLACLAVAPVGASDNFSSAKGLLAKLISIKTVAGNNETKVAANFLRDEFLKAGIPDSDITRVDHKGGFSSLIVRYRGNDTDKKAILVMAHMDVVPAERKDWSMDPFTLNEKDGLLLGRGVEDNKGGVATTASTIMRFAREGYKPDRDIILVYSGDEETNGYSLKDILQNHRALIEAEYALNTDAGGGTIREGVATSYSIQASEKTYLSFKLATKNSGGHSSLPRPDNAIYDLVNSLQRISRYQFPVMLNPVSTGYFKEMAKVSPAATSTAMRKLALDPSDSKAAKLIAESSPYYNAVMRTTCIATMLEAGHAENALPQSASAIINCRIVPTQSAGSVQETLTRLIANEDVTLSRVSEPTPSEPSPLRPDVLKALDATLLDIWGSLPIVPNMSTGATDGLYVRNAGIPVYGVSGIFTAETDGNAHGRDERIQLESFNKAISHWDGLLRRLTGGKI